MDSTPRVSFTSAQILPPRPQAMCRQRLFTYDDDVSQSQSDSAQDSECEIQIEPNAL